ncbi:MAG: sodium:proton antiporter [Verrucomicrobia bacterium]|nr:sodium:proton antiporter [Verrucomicrobiota bacterium]
MKLRWLNGSLSVALLALLGWAVLALPPTPRGLTGPALAELPNSGVTNPVTAALLNYRGYDTLLEVAVFLLALVGVWSLREGRLMRVDLNARPLLLSLLRLVLPVLVVAGGYLLWIGAFAPGGAFQGGALLGGAFVLLLLAGLGGNALKHEGWLRLGLALGLAVFAGVGGGVMLLTGGLLEYPRASAGSWILAIEAAALLSIGLTFGGLFLGGRPVAEGDAPPNPERAAHD